jgi:competence protein ComEC
LLALAVALLIVIDPFLVRTVGFQLSVAACAGIVLLARPLARVLPGPTVLSDALAVTIAAQAGVAPVLVLTFGGVPLASVPANLLAAPAAAAVMVWGVGAGLIAGLLGGHAAAVLHWPTAVLVGWIALVAHWSASWPLGELQARHVRVLAAGVVVVVVVGRLRAAGSVTRGVRFLGLGLIAIALLLPVLALRSPPDGTVPLGSGAVLWRAGGGTLLELDGRAQIGDVLEGLRRAGARQLDVVIVRTSSSSSAVAIETLRRWGVIGQVLTPVGARLTDGRVVVDPIELRVGGLDVAVTPDQGRLLVDVARGPPV